MLPQVRKEDMDNYSQGYIYIKYKQKFKWEEEKEILWVGFLKVFKHALQE
jgi:hypothetical protein